MKIELSSSLESRSYVKDVNFATCQVKVKVSLLCPTLCDPMEFSRPEYWSGQPFPSPGDLPNPGIRPRSPALQADSLPAETPVKPKNTGVGSLSLFQWIFPTQELNQGLLHGRQILFRQFVHLSFHPSLHPSIRSSSTHPFIHPSVPYSVEMLESETTVSKAFRVNKV